jgi:hypothetical protein
MMRTLPAAVAMTFCTFLAGCTQAKLVEKFTPPEKERLARSCVDLLIHGNLAQVQSQLDPNLVAGDTKDTLAKMSAMFPSEPPKSVKVVGLNIHDGNQYSETNLTFEYEFPSKWLVVNVDIQTKGAVTTIAGIHVEPLSESLENLNRFTLRGKSATQYSVLLAAVGLFLFSLYVLILCVRTPHVGRKWLWVIFILVGFGKLTVNWTNGELHFTPLAFNIPCASAAAPPYGPWTVGAFLPIGAILFLRERRKKLSEAIAHLPTPAPSDTPGS